ncbi:hypothetical protein Nepgr_000444 [Nepenthes gracilis]|uniref:Uncharacterized protein n=1 Tax=Nepenthes gracilis TaxID=150966 RepID=A0AAD3P1T1_NEPGR|nr:hypothetical protein Nepgr_000444 [Nepenthes gracilis]
MDATADPAYCSVKCCFLKLQMGNSKLNTKATVPLFGITLDYCFLLHVTAGIDLQFLASTANMISARKWSAVQMTDFLQEFLDIMNLQP